MNSRNTLRVDLHGINPVRKRLKAGVVEIHYAWRGRGAPAFWRSDSGIAKGSAAYLAAFAATSQASADTGLFRDILRGFLASGDFTRLSPRFQSDLRTSIAHPKNGIDQEFGGEKKAIFDHPGIRGVVLEWRDEIGGKVGNDRMRHLQQIVGWAVDRGKLRQSYLVRMKSTYESNRAEIIWTPAEVATFVAGSPAYVARILVLMTETGLRPGDLYQVGPEHVHQTPRGHRIVMPTNKRGRVVSIPLTPAALAIVKATPPGQKTFIVARDGKPFANENQLGKVVSLWRDKLNLRKDLRLYDARGTAATRLLQAGSDIREIAVHMGWSIKRAAEVIERYVSLSPEMADGIAAKLERIRDGAANFVTNRPS